LSEALSKKYPAVADILMKGRYLLSETAIFFNQNRSKAPTFRTQPGHHLAVTSLAKGIYLLTNSAFNSYIFSQNNVN
jgi:hypothetical protein